MKERDTMIKVRDLSFSFGNGKVLDGIGFDVRAGEILVIMGRSGCGKTTLLKVLVGLLRPREGRVEILGQNLLEMDEDRLDEFRERFGMLFQFGALINSLTIGENVLLTLQRGVALDGRIAQKVARAKLCLVGLPHVFDLYPSELSGGMKKRAGLARAMILDPEILFFDEPTSGLDPNTAAGLDELILEIRRLLGTTMVVVTHDLASALKVGDRILMMHEGRIIAEGTAEALRTSSDPVVTRFFERKPSEVRVEEDHQLASLFEEGV